MHPEIIESGLLQTQSFLKAVGAQLNKDFGLEEYFQIPEIIDAADVLARLNRLIENLLESDTEKLFAILYRIDLPENTVKSTFTSGQNDVTELCNQIFYRECLKVYFRIKYSSGNTSGELFQ